MKCDYIQQRNKQQGVALIIVLLIVAIVSVLATEMGSRLQLQIKRASNIKENNQAYWYAMGAEQYARKSIKTLMDEDGDTINLSQPWNQEFVYPIDGGGIQAQLVDMQSCFNLNALKVSTSSSSNLDPAEAFERLLQNIDAEIPSYNIEILSDSLVDWLDEDDSPTNFGAEDSEYESREFPYTTANNYMVHKSELRLIHGVEPAWFLEVLKYVCVLPNDNLFLINVNTVSDENAAIIAAAADIDLADAKSALSSRGEDGFDNLQDFFAAPEIQAASLSSEQQAWFTVKTTHFILHTKTKYNDATFAMQSVFQVGNNNEVKVIRREFSSFR